MSYYDNQRRPSYHSSSSSSRRPSGYGYGYQPPATYERSSTYDSGYESRGRSPPRREGRSSRRDVSPLGSSKYERPYEAPRRKPSYVRGASREPLSGYESSPYSRPEDFQARGEVSSFYSRDPYDRYAPPRPGTSQLRDPPRPDPVSSCSSRRPSGPYGVDISSMGGGYDVGGMYGSSSSRRPSSSRRSSDGPDFSRGSGFGYGYDPGMDGVEPPPRRHNYPPPAMGNYYGGGPSGSLSGSHRRPSRGYY